MPWYMSPAAGGSTTPAPTTPPAPKTANYTFTSADGTVPIQFNAVGGALTGTLPDPATVAGITFIAVKMDASTNPVNISAPVGGVNGMPMFSLADQFASLIVMAANGTYTIVAQSAV